MSIKNNVIEVIKTCVDPELNVDIWTLGLIYEVELKDEKTAFVKMTFTSPMCPFGPQIVQELKTKLEKIGFVNTTIEVTFTPPWSPTEELREMLGV